jgi:RimJ/RimL family protein N-acetyltransferase
MVFGEFGEFNDGHECFLRDGSPIIIRPIEHGDGEALAAFHLGQSPESIHQRFFGAHPRLSEAEVLHFTHVDGRLRMALVALMAGELVGVGRYDYLPDQRRAEVAFVVSDRHHNQGIASSLLARLARYAVAAGISTFVAEVLGQNHPMINVFRHSGLSCITTCSGDTVWVTLALETQR